MGNSIGVYNGTEIFWDGEDPGQFINATQMCKATGKRWNDYRGLDSTQDFLDALSRHTNISVCELVRSSRARSDHGGGTWVHRRVAIHLAQWCSPDFAVWVTGKIEQLMTTGRVVLHREYQEAELIATRVWETLDQIAKVQLHHSHGLSNLETKVDRLGEDVAEIREAISTKRIAPNEKTKRQHVETVHYRFGGKCPCCLEIYVVDSSCRKTACGEFDHWEMRSKNSAGETWLVCRSCNAKLKDPEFKRRRRDMFNAYQQRRVEGVFPLLTDDRN